MRIRRRLSVCGLVIAGTLAIGPRAAHSLDRDTVSAALQVRVVEPATVQSEIEAFVLRRIPAMPEPKTVAEWEQFANKARQDTFSKVIFRGEAAKWRELPTKPEWQGEIDCGDYRIRKLRFEAVPGTWVPALLYEPKKLSGKVPVAMNVNGHDAKGKAADYKQIRCINMAKRGMLVLNIEWFNMGQLAGPDFDHYKMNQLDLCGTSGIACFYLAMSRGIDVLLAHDNADPNRVAVSGLSGGGWQTIFISSLDDRVTLSDPVAGYSSFRTRAKFYSDLGDSEQTPNDLATTADYAILTAMRAPRPTLLTFNDRDNCCFAAGHALPPLLEAARPIYRLYDKLDSLAAHVNHIPGTHNFERDNREALYRMIGQHFYPDAKFDAVEIPCEKEVKTADELKVDLPADNAGFNTLAKRLAKDLPRAPHDSSPDARRKRLAEILRYSPVSVATAEAVATEMKDDVTIHRWKLNIADRWTLPATEFIPEGATRSVVILSDAGRTTPGETIETLLKQKTRVLAVDPYNTGESKIPSHDFLFGLLVAATGERPLGVMTAQINAVTDWWARETSGPVEVNAIGRRTSLATICASALNVHSIKSVSTKDGLASLKQIIDEGVNITAGPEFFCFGLLEEFDIPQIAELGSK